MEAKLHLVVIFTTVVPPRQAAYLIAKYLYDDAPFSEHKA